MQDAFRCFFRREIPDRAPGDLRRLAADEKLFTPKVAPAGVVMEVGFVLDLEAPVLKRQELHRCGREAVIPSCFATRTVKRALYLAPIAITRMTRAPSADEQLLIFGPDDESCDSSCAGILINPASGDRIRADGCCSEDEWKQPQAELHRVPSSNIMSQLHSCDNLQRRS